MPLKFQFSKTPFQRFESLFGDLITATRDGFAAVAKAITDPQTPEPPPAQPKGELVSRYRVPADLPDFSFELVGRNFTDSEGNPTGAADVDLSLDNTNPAAVSASLGPQTVSDDGKEVKAIVSAHVGAPSVDMSVLAYKATNRTNGNVLAADSDEFIVGPGTASVGTLDSPVPLTPEPEG